MASLMPKELRVTLKRETVLYLEVLCNTHPMPENLSRQIFADNALEKLTQSVFYNLTYYLISIVDQAASTALPWPLYDIQSDRKYRNQLSNFVSDYSSKGLLTPVISSYFVNPGCHKVTYFVFELSQLALQRVLKSKLKSDSKKTLYTSVTKKFKSQDTEFVCCVEKENNAILCKFSYYLCKKQAMEKAAEVMRKRIISMENTLKTLKAQEYVDNLVDGIIEQNASSLDEKSRKELLEIKNFNIPAQFFENFLEYCDKRTKKIESEWGDRVTPLLTISKQAVENTKALVARHTGEADEKSFTVEYNPKIDYICTRELEAQVNSEQQYILKNIVKEGKLYFPNLIRSFVVAISFILRNTEFGNEIYEFNEYLEDGQKRYSEMVSVMRMVVEKIKKLDSRVEPRPLVPLGSTSMREWSEIPPIPDLSDIMTLRDNTPVTMDIYTPLNVNKHQFNLRRKVTESFTKPLPKISLTTPFFKAPQSDFLKSVISCRVSDYDRLNITQNMNNLSVISQGTNRANETIAECTSGFTKEQLTRLLSTKSSSSKKFKAKTQRLQSNIKKAKLFNDSNISYDSVVLMRSHSSPNLFENREKRHIKSRSRKLSIMKEGSPSLLEVSGIAALERDSNHSTPQGLDGVALDSCRKLTDSTSLPTIVTSNINERESNNYETKLDLNKEIQNDSTESSASSLATVLPQHGSWNEKTEKRNSAVESKKADTPKNERVIQKTSSLEKIINRYKKFRASILPTQSYEEDDNKSAVEEKENLKINNFNGVAANRTLLPDLLSPSCSFIGQKSNDNLEDVPFVGVKDKPRKQRVSLGAALGVDATILDQFDLID